MWDNWSHPLWIAKHIIKDSFMEMSISIFACFDVEWLQCKLCEWINYHYESKNIKLTVMHSQLK